MEPSTALIATAQVGVAVAGFAGVVAMFRGKAVHEWGPVQKFWLRLLLLNSILPFVFSLFGLFCLAVTAPSAPSWRLCSGFAVFWLVPYGALIMRNLTGFKPEQLKASGGGRAVSYLLFSLLVLVLLLQLWNTTLQGAFWPFYAAILSLLSGSMFQFVRLVLAPAESADTTQG